MSVIQPKIVSSPDYDIHFFGIEMLHPFDSRKYGRAWKELRRHFGEEVASRTIQPENEIDDDDLLMVHTREYLETLKSSPIIARAVEMAVLASVPYRLLRSRLIHPMRLATRGTVIAGFEAMENGIAVNLSGGYHHASREQGEGFCLYADVPLAIEKLRDDGLLAEDETAIIIDLDAHQGNGHERIYRGQEHAFIFDMYNQSIYPMDHYARERIDYHIPLNSGVNSSAYLDLLHHKLPEALDRVHKPGIAFYIAGTDIYEGDLLGGMKVSEDAVLQRDRFVIDQFVSRGIPLAIVLGGGYSKESYRMVTAMVAYILEKWGDAATKTTSP